MMATSTKVSLAAVSLTREDGLREISCAIHALRSHLHSSYSYPPPFRVRVHEFETTDPDETIVERVLSDDPAAIGFSCYVWNLSKVVRVCRAIRPHSRAMIILGGPEMHPGSRELVADGTADVVVIGEGEESLREVLDRTYGCETQGRDLEGISGVLWQDEATQEVHCNPVLPAEHRPSYPAPWARGQVQLCGDGPYSATLEWARGCPWGCSYCSWGACSPFHIFPLEEVLQDLRCIINDRRVQELFVCHTDAFIQSENARAFMEALRDINHSNIPVYMTVHLQSLETSLLDAAAFTPALALGLGIQSTASQVLAACNRKAPDPERYSWLQNAGRSRPYPLQCDLIVGLPEQTEQTFRQSMRDVIRFRPMAVNTYRLQIMPNSALWNARASLGIVAEEDVPHRVLSTPLLSGEVLHRLTRLAFWAEIAVWDVCLRDVILTIDACTDGSVHAVAVIEEAFAPFADDYDRTVHREMKSLVCTTDYEHVLKTRLYSHMGTAAVRREVLCTVIAIAERVVPEETMRHVRAVCQDYDRVLRCHGQVPQRYLGMDAMAPSAQALLAPECLVTDSCWSPAASGYQFDEAQVRTIVLFTSNESLIGIEAAVRTLPGGVRVAKAASAALELLSKAGATMPFEADLTG